MRVVEHSITSKRCGFGLVIYRWYKLSLGVSCILLCKDELDYRLTVVFRLYIASIKVWCYLRFSKI